MLPGLLKIICISGNAMFYVYRLDQVCHSRNSDSVATLSKTEIGEITCNIFYFSTTKMYHFSVCNQHDKLNEIFHVLFSCYVLKSSVCFMFAAHFILGASHILGTS